MSLLTDDARDIVATLAPWAAFGALVFVGYALSRHVDWQDAVALTLVLRFVLVALARRP